MVSYRDSGVDVELGNDVSKILYNAAKLTWENRKGKLGEVVVPFDDFSGLRYVRVDGLPKGTVMNLGFDGIGTKVNLAQRTRNHRTMGYDLIAMVAEDCLVRGAEPVLLGSVLDVRSLGPKEDPYLDEVRQLAEGYINAAKAANVAVVSGETAELPVCVEGYSDRIKYNWGAGIAWFANEERLFTGREIIEGDSLVGLQEMGFRSNGLSLLRRVLEKAHGDNYHRIPWKNDPDTLAYLFRNKFPIGENGLTLGDMALIPSKIYTKAVIDMTGGWDLRTEPRAIVHGVAHITGGGIVEKLDRVLRASGLGATLESPLEPPQFMEYVQALGNVNDREAYKTWNMGPGLIVITPQPDKVIDIAKKHGIFSDNMGRIEKQKGIRIKNRGAFAPDKCPKGGLFSQGEKFLEF